MGTQAAEADEEARRPGGGACATGASVQPQDNGESASPSAGDSAAAGLARLRANLRERAVGQVAWYRAERRDSASVDDRSRVVEEPGAQAGASALLAAAAQRLWRTGAMGHLRARLVGRARASALFGAAHRRRHQLELGPLCGAGCDAAE